MRRFASALLALAASAVPLAVYCQPAPSGDAVAPAVRVGADRRAELLAILFKLAGNPEYNQNRLEPYNADIQRQFGPFRAHEAVARARALAQQRGTGYDAVMALAIRLTDPPALAERAAFDSAAEPRLPPGETRAFLAAARRFVADAHADQFFAAHQALYDSATARLRRVVGRYDAAGWEGRFFGTAPDRAFVVVPLLANSGGNFGPCVQPTTPAGAPKECYAVLGHEETDAAGFPTYGDGLVLTFVHELTHGYANPLGDAHRAEFARSAPRVHAFVADQMRRQGYGDDWMIMVNESLVRAAVARYGMTLGNPAAVERYLAGERARGWVWIDDLVALLGAYEADRRAYPTFAAFMPRVVAFYDALPARMPELVRRYGAPRPAGPGGGP